MIKRTRNLIDNYSIIDNRPINDKQLSFEARGLLVYLLSKPNDWKVSPANIQAQGRVGKFKAYAMLKELMECGYAKRITRRDGAGRIVATDYEIRDIPLVPTQWEQGDRETADSPTTNE